MEAERWTDDGGKRVMREITLKVNVLFFSFKIIKMYEKVKWLFLLDPWGLSLTKEVLIYVEQRNSSVNCLSRATINNLGSFLVRKLSASEALLSCDALAFFLTCTCLVFLWHSAQINLKENVATQGTNLLSYNKKNHKYYTNYETYRSN